MDIVTLITSFEAFAVYYVLFFIATVCSTFLAVRSVTEPPSKRHQIILFATAIFFWTVYTVFGWRMINKLSTIPRVVLTSPRAHEILKSQAQDVTITFQTPVNYKDIHVYLYPEIDFVTEYKGYLFGALPYGRSIVITPKMTLPPGQRVMVFLSDIKGPLTYEFGGEFELELVSSDLPSIERIEPSDTKADVPPTTVFTVHLTDPIAEIASWSAQIEPSHELTITTKDSRTLSINPVKPFIQNTRYALSIIQTPMILTADKRIVELLSPRLEKKLTFRTVKPPFVRSLSPLGLSVNPAEPLTIEFEEPMDRESVEALLKLTPAVPLTLVWSNNGQTLQLRHAGLNKDTTYFAVIGKGMKTARGGVSQSDAVFQFHTAGPVMIANSSPINGATQISTSSRIRITLDQTVDPTSLIQRFSITPEVKGKTVVHGNNSLDFTPEKQFAFNTRYTITLAPGIESVYGLPSDKPQTIAFTTQADEIALAVPFYKQQESFTCNIAAARMMLAYRGVNVDEAKLKSLTGNGGKRGSGNPHKGYIDDYGTYWEPIEKAVSAYRPHRMITSGKIEDIIAELKKGNPVMIWGQNGWSDPHDLSWTTPDGIYIKAVNGMHSSVVRGFVGPDTNPTHVLLNDPWRGQYTIGVKEFMRRWSFFNVAMVVE